MQLFKQSTETTAAKDNNESSIAQECHKIITESFDVLYQNLSQADFGIFEFDVIFSATDKGKEVTAKLGFTFNSLIGLLVSFPKNVQLSKDQLGELYEKVSTAEKKLLKIKFK